MLTATHHGGLGRRPVTGGNDHLTKLLIAAGANGSTAFADTSIGSKHGVSRHAITRYGNTVCDSTVGMGGRPTAIYFDGSGDYLEVANHADFDLADHDWTLDFVVRYASVTASGGAIRAVIGNADISVGEGFFGFQENATEGYDFLIKFHSGGVNLGAVRTDGSLANNTTYHIAVQRLRDKIMLFRDGVKQATELTFSGAFGVPVRPFSLGRVPGAVGWSDFHGRLGEIRWCLGAARYPVSGFAPPVTPYKAWE